LAASGKAGGERMPGSTIFALSSGHLPSGVAIIRISGPECGVAIERIVGGKLNPRMASLRNLTHPASNEFLDEVIALWFPGPASFTGDDVLEIHCHGGVATVSAILDALSALEHYRLAEPGEFSRRAFENGRLDLTELEGLSDLISAQTEEQRRQASVQAGGGLRILYEKWRSDLIRIRSHIEAEMDFADEGDVNESDAKAHRTGIHALLDEICDHLDDGNRGQIVREGLKVVLAGPPNAGKSSLLNALAKRDVAIVTPHAGTTRDIVEVQLNIGGHLVKVLDTAGIRSTNDEIEQAGIQKSHNAMRDADLIFWLQDTTRTKIFEVPANALEVQTKTDLGLTNEKEGSINISTVSPHGIDPIINAISTACRALKSRGENNAVSRRRYRDGLLACSKELEQALSPNLAPEIVCEHLRLASDAIGRITGKIDVEDLLDVIFSEFCIGK